ncbi:MAG: hypothetical protein U9R27_00015 [Campylobacterota bacterium]|nr:hypothetical protein [Campylobacterota bacterium]
MKIYLLILSFLVPTTLFTNYVMNQYYGVGSGVCDVGWFTFLMTQTDSWPLLNPLAGLLDESYFSTHLSLFYYPLSFLYSFVEDFVSPPLYYSLFIGSMYGLISLAVFVAGLRLLPNSTFLSLLLLCVIAILTSMNGAALGLIGFPHIEIAIPALMLLFISLYFSGYVKSSYIVFLMLLTIREDAGFHLFGLLSIVLLSMYVMTRDKKSLPKELIAVALVGLIYSFSVIYLQKTFYPGDNALERIYLGKPHFAHLTADFISGRIQFILTDRAYLYIPLFFTILMAFVSRNIFLLSSFIATLPWLFLSLIAISSMPGHLSNYYAFPFITALSWPMFAYLIAHRVNPQSMVSYKKIIVSVALITGSSIILFPGNRQNFDTKPWEKFDFAYLSTMSSSDQFVSALSKHKSDFGDILFDEPLAALMVETLTKDEYGYINDFFDYQIEEADTVIFNMSSLEALRGILDQRQLHVVYRVRGTDIVIATDKRFRMDPLSAEIDLKKITLGYPKEINTQIAL